MVGDEGRGSGAELDLLKAIFEDRLEGGGQGIAGGAAKDGRARGGGGEDGKAGGDGIEGGEGIVGEGRDGTSERCVKVPAVRFLAEGTAVAEDAEKRAAVGRVLELLAEEGQAAGIGIEAEGDARVDEAIDVFVAKEGGEEAGAEREKAGIARGLVGDAGGGRRRENEKGEEGKHKIQDTGGAHNGDDAGIDTGGERDGGAGGVAGVCAG